MKIGIIGAMDEEIEILKKEMTLQNMLEKATMLFYEGRLLEKEVVLVTCGIGKVNAAVCTQILIDRFDVDCIINVGIAGGLAENIYPGDIVIADTLVQHDMDATFFGDALGQVPRMKTFDYKCDVKLIDEAKVAIEKIDNTNTFIGRIVSGDQFMHEADKLRKLNAEFSALACEMEGASIGQVCYLNNMPFVVIRSISDNAINGSHMDYETFSGLAIENSVKILKDMLQNM